MADVPGVNGPGVADVGSAGNDRAAVGEERQLIALDHET